MGYYSKFSVDYKTAESDFASFIYYTTGDRLHNLELDMARKLCEISDWFDEDEIYENEDCPFSELIEHETLKWYDYEEDMTKLSEFFPYLKFELEILGEDGRMEKAFFFNGKSFVSEAKIVYERPEWDQG